MEDDAFFQRTIRIVESSNRRLSDAQIWKKEKQKGYANPKHSARLSDGSGQNAMGR